MSRLTVRVVIRVTVSFLLRSRGRGFMSGLRQLTSFSLVRISLAVHDYIRVWGIGVSP